MPWHRWKRLHQFHSEDRSLVQRTDASTGVVEFYIIDSFTEPDTVQQSEDNLDDDQSNEAGIGCKMTTQVETIADKGQ